MLLRTYASSPQETQARLESLVGERRRKLSEDRAVAKRLNTSKAWTRVAEREKKLSQARADLRRVRSWIRKLEREAAETAAYREAVRS